jgi:hypothetical protein
MLRAGGLFSRFVRSRNELSDGDSSMRTALRPLLFGLAMLSTACANNPVPKDYSGPTATLFDTVTRVDGGRGLFFVLEKYNDTPTFNAYSSSVSASQGMGRVLKIENYSRKIPLESAKFHILGISRSAAPIVNIIKDYPSVSGDVLFTPELNHLYYVEGNIGKDTAAIWIRDGLTNQTIQKFELKGAAAFDRYRE